MIIGGIRKIVIGSGSSWLARRLTWSARLLAKVADEIGGLVNRAAAEMHAHWPSSLTVEPRQRLGRNRQAKISEELRGFLAWQQPLQFRGSIAHVELHSSYSQQQ